MSLDPTRLGLAIAAAMIADPAVGAGTNPAALAATAALGHAIALAVVAEIAANAVVLPTALLSASPGSAVTGTGKVA